VAGNFLPSLKPRNGTGQIDTVVDARRIGWRKEIGCWGQVGRLDILEEEKHDEGKQQDKEDLRRCKR
jgi:hypothetical protein